MKREPTIFHVTNYKAGSQWVAEILKYSAPERFIKASSKVGHFLENPSLPGRIYPTVYVSQQDFSYTITNKQEYQYHHHGDILKNTYSRAINMINYRLRRYPFKVFVVIRDLRDILVSKYYSLRVSHTITSENIKTNRQKLKDLDKNEGIMHVLRNNMQIDAIIQTSWYPAHHNNDVLLIKYEDLLKDEYEVFDIIIDYCEIDIERTRLHEIIQYNSFATATGRERGQENVNEHLRKGIAGDWKNHFSSQLKEEFKKRYGKELIITGYEKDLNW